MCFLVNILLFEFDILINTTLQNYVLFRNKETLSFTLKGTVSRYLATL